MKIIIVDSAPDTINHSLGEHIDSYDIVIRLGDFNTKYYEEYVGKKTDIWVHSRKTKFKTSVKNIPTVWVPIYKSAYNAPNGKTLTKEQFIVNKTSLDEYKRPPKKGEHPYLDNKVEILFRDSYIQKVNAAHNFKIQNASMQLFAILYALNRFNERIVIHGLNYEELTYTGESNDHYDSNVDYEYEKKVIDELCRKKYVVILSH